MADKPSLLIVDDETNIALTLQLVFEREGYAVHTANSASGALKLLRNGHLIDAVITDLNMEKENIGLEVARAALRLNPRPAVLLCTGYASVDNSVQALAMKVDYLVTKPVDLDELKRAVSRLMAWRAQSGQGNSHE